jgi:hypothetical protein
MLVKGGLKSFKLSLSNSWEEKAEVIYAIWIAKLDLTLPIPASNGRSSPCNQIESHHPTRPIPVIKIECNPYN